MIRRTLAVVGLAIAAFAAVTLVAVEGPEVVELRTRTAGGGLRTTRIWIVDDDGVEWIEAGNPERPFLADLLARPDVEIVRAGTPRAVRAEPVWGEEAHRRIRDQLRRKYGWADAWVGLLVDTSRSVAIRLVPLEAGRGG